MAHPKILDTHIHLWPSTATSPTDHGWMTPGHSLAKRHGITDYRAATQSSRAHPAGFVYVETDRYLPRPAPAIQDTDSEEAKEEKLRIWAKAPLEELAFLRRIVEGTPEEGDGFTVEESGLLKGVVVWAPFHLSRELFDLYLRIVEKNLGAEGWKKVVGFRYLLQGKGVEGVSKVVESEAFVGNLRAIGGKAFDVGVDCHRDGVEVLELIAKLVDRVARTERGDTPKFVLNHLCKPDLSTPHTTSPTFPRWSAALTHLATHQNVYMKLSGAFNEFTPSPTPPSVEKLLDALAPYLDRVYEEFGAGRILFGSDWPVCNVGGPKGEEGNWELWRDVVETWMDEWNFGEEIRERVWWRAGCAAYGLEGV